MTPAKILGLLLVIVYIAAVQILAALGIRSVFEHPVLSPILNTLFVGIIPVTVAYTAGKVYVKGGCGTLPRFATVGKSGQESKEVP
ncbi:MAG TPA: hypothetical protein VK463_01405 [Desulfomonilaceae bacterium]|nr:hypothetical protein [Desulfomonilaceae bacterium]